MSKRIIGLECPECGIIYPQELTPICKECWGPLKVKYDYEIIKNKISKEKLNNRAFNQWRYIELLPIEDSTKIISLNDGGTPLLRCKNLGNELGLKELYVKNDTINPTLSFKDRPASVGISKCNELGINTVGCASTGNLAASTAAHAAIAGFLCYIFVPANIEYSKITQTAIHGVNIIGVKGTYDAANRLGILVTEVFKWGLLNINVRPYYTEGSKTIAFETCEQLNWESPDNIIVPMGSGALLCSVYRALTELQKIGFIKNNNTQISGAQPSGCSPIVTSKNTKSDIFPIENPDTLAKSLAIGNPASGYEAINVINSTNGSANAPTDSEITDAIKLLAKREGIYAEPAGAITLAALINLVRSGEISKDESVVLLVTGNGFKAHQTVTNLIPQIPIIEPTLDALEKYTKKKEAIVVAKN
ncbi:MAG: threonine synthase [Candidatus Helarchaeota archaeon]|nr:threonine synthase [Candidatus Helarchaeota archaeon]